MAIVTELVCIQGLVAEFEDNDGNQHGVYFTVYLRAKELDVWDVCFLGDHDRDTCDRAHQWIDENLEEIRKHVAATA